MKAADLRKRIGQEFEGECHLKAEEAKRLFDVLDAAESWRSTPCSDLQLCNHGDHDNDCATNVAERVLVAAVDAFKAAP